MITSRERVIRALNHQTPDRVPLDLGASGVTGISASALYTLQRALGLGDAPVRVHEPYQMLGEVDERIMDALGVDVVGLRDDSTMFGFPTRNWKPWTLFDGTPVLVPGGFNTDLAPDGTLYQYPQGVKAFGPSGRMPPGGYYHDAIDRQEPYDETTLDPEEWVRDMYHVYTDEELALLEQRAQHLYTNTTRAIFCAWGQGGFGDIAFVTGTGIPKPKGIRAVADWYMATKLYPNYIRGIFALQCEIALKNLQLLKQAVGDRIAAIYIGGTDYGTQTSTFVSADAYREMWAPYHKALCDWIHANTRWKTFFHSCGSMITLFDEFVAAGADIVNPVQISAKGMDPAYLKERWGDKLVFWGGGVDTQQVLPFGTPEQVRADVIRNTSILAKGGGMVFSTVHNIQANTPRENLLALYEAFAQVRDCVH
jgi:hypothetical protein